MASPTEDNAQRPLTSLRAERSNPSRLQPQQLDCFVATLLAMTFPDACGQQLQTEESRR